MFGFFSAGLEQMMLTLPKSSQIAAIIGDRIYGPRVVDGGNNDNFWETVVFSSNMAIFSSALSIKSAFQRLKNNLLNKFSTPNVVILTASNARCGIFSKIKNCFSHILSFIKKCWKNPLLS